MFNSFIRVIRILLILQKKNIFSFKFLIFSIELQEISDIYPNPFIHIRRMKDGRTLEGGNGSRSGSRVTTKAN